ncbi:MAG TPA: DUF3810 family protein [Vicinamibacterales bacterium]|nr:DUF3810 family protein [Vicinamibacterales bacterium]
MIRRAGWLAAFTLAGIAAFAPLPAGVVERWYSRGAFPALQHVLTAASNLVPFAVFDALWMGGVALTVVLVRRRVLSFGWRAGLLRTLGSLACAAVIIYLSFLAAWGLNYRRVPMFEKIVFDPDRITPAANVALGEWAVAELNARYAEAHVSPLSIDALRDAFQDTHRALGGTAILPGRPKSTLLGWYFHEASIAGMTDPFLLETLLAPDLLEVERPFVIAHEWAHLAGYADESEANFVAYLACGRGDAVARYSAALIMIGYAQPARALRDALDIGPKTDLVAIQTRYAHTSGTLRFAAREGYDKYLKANRVEKGVRSYDAVVQLILGSEFDSRGNPRLR